MNAKKWSFIGAIGGGLFSVAYLAIIIRFYGFLNGLTGDSLTPEMGEDLLIAVRWFLISGAALSLAFTLIGIFILRAIIKERKEVGN